MRTQRRLSDSEREERRDRDRERLKHAAEQLPTSDGATEESLLTRAGSVSRAFEGEGWGA